MRIPMSCLNIPADSERFRLIWKTKCQIFYEICNNDSNNYRFWDIVVVTVMNAEFKLFMEKHIDYLKQNKKIPKSCEYIIINDPTIKKVGSGGATIHSYNKLVENYGFGAVARSRILIIHNGGFSTRLPHASIFGKLLVTIPNGNELIDALQLKLISYVDICNSMAKNYGMIISCSDILEIFSYNDNLDNKFDVIGFGIKSDIINGTKHGVYQVNINNCDLIGSTILPVKNFLHKCMANHLSSICFYDENHSQDSIVFVDGVYYATFDFFDSLSRIYYGNPNYKNCELEAFKDFLCPLVNTNYSSDYFSEIDEFQASLSEFKHTFGVQLYVDSCYFHFGTMTEYIDNFKSSSLFSLITSKQNLLQNYLDINYDLMKMLKNNTVFKCIIHYLDKNSHFGKDSVLELSELTGNVSIGDECILYNVHIIDNYQSIIIPDRTLLMVVTILDKCSEIKFVPFFMSINENPNEKNNFTICNRNIDDIVDRKMFKDCIPFCLWNLKIFPSFFSKHTACNYACSIINKLNTDSSFKFDSLMEFDDLYSFNEVFNSKNIESMYDDQVKFLHRIKVLNNCIS